LPAHREVFNNLKFGLAPNRILCLFIYAQKNSAETTLSEPQVSTPIRLKSYSTPHIATFTNLFLTYNKLWKMRFKNKQQSLFSI